MEHMTLTKLFSEKLFQIPDYQRGYAWEAKQLNDFIEDIDALTDPKIRSHYTGTVVVYQDKDKSPQDYGSIDRFDLVDVVDGQQRLTTSCLYLSIILRTLIDKGETVYQQKIPAFLYSDNTCKISLNNETGDLFYDLIKKGQPNTSYDSIHQIRLINAYGHLNKHIQKQLANKNEDGVQYLKNICDAIVRKLIFTYYTIEEECEIGMTFELMNSRGKALSILELLKNYLMHWVSRNEENDNIRKAMTGHINKNWKDTYINIGACDGNEDQCLRVAWILYCNHTPKNWQGYHGFKQDQYIPLRRFDKRSKEDTKKFIQTFSDKLAEISLHYACITSPIEKNTLCEEELVWLTKIHHTGNIANFLPLMVIARYNFTKGLCSESEYIEILKSLECFAYRVYLFENKRSNAGKSSFYSWANELRKEPRRISSVAQCVRSLIEYYSSKEDFVQKANEPFNWYSYRGLLKYTLFEYELHLLETEGKGQKPKLEWNDLCEATIEHILPQTPKDDSHWNRVWDKESIQLYLHDIGNLVLTVNNSNYFNFEFEKKKGSPGVSPSYYDSNIKQERKIASFDEWTPDSVRKRRKTLIAWITERWDSKDSQYHTEPDIFKDMNVEDDNEAEVGVV